MKTTIWKERIWNDSSLKSFVFINFIRNLSQCPEEPPKVFCKNRCQKQIGQNVRKRCLKIWFRENWKSSRFFFMTMLKLNRSVRPKVSDNSQSFNYIWKEYVVKLNVDDKCPAQLKLNESCWSFISLKRVWHTNEYTLETLRLKNTGRK